MTLLGNCRRLEDLHLHYSTANETDLSPLAGFEKLEHLCIPARGEDVTIDKVWRNNVGAIKSAGLRQILSEDAKAWRSRRAEMVSKSKAAVR